MPKPTRLIAFTLFALGTRAIAISVDALPLPTSSIATRAPAPPREVFVRVEVNRLIAVPRATALIYGTGLVWEKQANGDFVWTRSEPFFDTAFRMATDAQISFRPYQVCLSESDFNRQSRGTFEFLSYGIGQVRAGLSNFMGDASRIMASQFAADYAARSGNDVRYTIDSNVILFAVPNLDPLVDFLTRRLPADPDDFFDYSVEYQTGCEKVSALGEAGPLGAAPSSSPLPVGAK